MIDESKKIDPNEIAGWFAGNAEATALYMSLVEVAHTWDDLVDQDKPVTADRINNAFLLCLVAIPSNKVYQALFPQLQPLLLTAFTGYVVANKYEKDKDEHGIEIAHMLRYSVVQVVTFLIVHFNGVNKAVEILPAALKRMIPERFDDYRKEHG